MWRTIEHVLMSPNVTIILLFVVFVIVIGLILSKTGLLNVHTRVVEIGATNKEREIIRRQMEWINIHLEGMENTLPKDEHYNIYRGKYIKEIVFDEYMKMITQNHITTDEDYIESHQETIVSLVFSLTEKKEYRSKKFREMLENDVKECIEKLVQIRNIYK